MRAQANGIGQHVRMVHRVFHKLFFLVIRIQIDPDRHGQQQYQTDRENQLCDKTVMDFRIIFQHFSESGNSHQRQRQPGFDFNCHFGAGRIGRCHAAL
jgi:hypothetical protein